MVFNYTLPTDVSSLPALGTYMNSVTDNVFGITILMGVWAVFFISMSRRYNMTTCAMVASWMAFLASLFTMTMGWTNILYTILFMLATAATSIMSFTERN